MDIVQESESDGEYQEQNLFYFSNGDNNNDEPLKTLYMDPINLLEKAELDKITTQKELDYYAKYVKSTGSPQKAIQHMKSIHFNVQQETGYHVDCWPPKLVSLDLRAEKIDDIGDYDRIKLMEEKINKFRKRARICPEDTDDTVLIVVENDDAIRQILKSNSFENICAITDSYLDHPNAIRMLIDNWKRSVNTDILLCTINILIYDRIPLTKCTFLHKIKSVGRFKQAILNRTVLSRMEKKKYSHHYSIEHFRLS